ncbi:hypothetical protein CYY_005363 [Polysphondylium violaceum]|uniref:BTB domain-containing protein n=1 Tax=Polysphondylium violaceum TaxID=133409 RepID=A0A8J4PUB9_9MYCE|nr:hypothetical protein CYY_005363 [Polysphondylium violaceum]
MSHNRNNSFQQTNSINISNQTSNNNNNNNNDASSTLLSLSPSYIISTSPGSVSSFFPITYSSNSSGSSNNSSSSNNTNSGTINNTPTSNNNSNTPTFKFTQPQNLSQIIQLQVNQNDINNNNNNTPSTSPSNISSSPSSLINTPSSSNNNRTNNTKNLHKGSTLYESPLFQNGFGNYLKSFEFSDVTIIANGKSHHLHKVILSHSSKLFSDLFDRAVEHQNNEYLVYKGKDTYELKCSFVEFFESVLFYIYNGRANLTSKNALPILSLSNTFAIKGLKKVATYFLTSSITKENALSMLNKAVHIDSEDLISKSITVICKHFNQIILPNSFYNLNNNNDELNSNNNNNNNNVNNSNNSNSVQQQTITSTSTSTDDTNINTSTINTQFNIDLIENDDYEDIVNNINNSLVINNSDNNIILDETKNNINNDKINNIAIDDKSLDTSTINTIPELLSLPLNIMIRLMKQNNLSVSNEAIVYKTVVKYIQMNRAVLNEADINSLFEVVRFPLFNYQQLEEVQDHPLIPRYLVTEALLQRLKYHEGPKNELKSSTPGTNTSNSPIITQINTIGGSTLHINSTSSSSGSGSNSNPMNATSASSLNINMDIQEESSLTQMRKTPRTAYATSLEHVADFDKFGLFYYIGTNGGKEEWSNPALRGRVRVTFSSQEKGNATDCVGRTPSECWTMDVPASWISINLGSSRTMVPTSYTLRHGGNSKADCLRNWTLQGSMDSKNWTVLVRHSNDSSLNGNFSTCTWPIPNCTQAYRHFRILQTGRNSSNHNFLSISGIEFYGDLYETRSQI